MLLLNHLAKKESWKEALLFLLSQVRHLHPPGKNKTGNFKPLIVCMYVCVGVYMYGDWESALPVVLCHSSLLFLRPGFNNLELSALAGP